MTKVLFNGKVVKEESLKLDYNSDWAKFAPGFFETMKVYKGQILFWGTHYKRMKLGANFWKVKLPRKDKLERQLQKLLSKNDLTHARLRIQFNASLDNSTIEYFASAIPLQESEEYNWIENGWQLGLYKEHYKSKDANGFKSNNRNIYLLARKWAIGNSFDDALVMNTEKRITDSTSCSLFWVKKGKIFSPPTKEGGVDGTFGKFLRSKQKDWNIKVTDKICTVRTLIDADEIFLTNVIRGFRWVKSFRGKEYNYTVSQQLYKHLKEWERTL